MDNQLTQFSLLSSPSQLVSERNVTATASTTTRAVHLLPGEKWMMGLWRWAGDGTMIGALNFASSISICLSLYVCVW